MMKLSIEKRIKKVKKEETLAPSNISRGKLRIDRNRGFQGHSITDKKPSYYKPSISFNIEKGKDGYQ